MGWCTVGSHGEECGEAICEQIDGNYQQERTVGCLVLSLLEDPTAIAVIRALVYPPILLVRDELPPDRRVGAVAVGDFERHYEEAMRILRGDPDLLTEVIEFLVARVPFARALTGEVVDAAVPPRRETPSTYTAQRLRAGMVDSFSRLLERFRSAAEPDLAARIELYQLLLPELVDHTPRELLAVLDDPRLVGVLEPAARAGSGS